AFIVYLVLAMHEHPQWGARLRKAVNGSRQPDKTDEMVRCFVQEVRRFYPFFPAVPAIVREDFTWRGQTFEAGTRVLLDRHGTNHDPRRWDQPEVFNPMRFHSRAIDAYEFIPQGPGDYAANHRCAGETLTIALMESAARFF